MSPALDAILDEVRQARPEELAAIRGKLHEADAVAMEREIEEAMRKATARAIPERDFTPREFAELARFEDRRGGIRVKTVYEKAAAAKDPLPIRRLGGKITVPRASGLAWLERHVTVKSE